MNSKELAGKSATDLRAELLKLRKEQFNLRMASAAGQPAKPDQFGKVRKNIARVKTAMSAKNGAKTAGGKG